LFPVKFYPATDYTDIDKEYQFLNQLKQKFYDKKPQVYYLASMRKYIDLHTHSTASDGTLSPGELAVLAAESDIAALALTDHDSIAGLDEAEAAAERLGLEFIRGCELSCKAEYGNVHILGLWMPRALPEFEQSLVWLREERRCRNQRIVEKLGKLGMSIDLAELPQNPKSPGRPHIAGLLLRKGYVKSIRDAFERFLGRGKAAYVSRENYTPAEAVKLLSRTRALVVLAHPMLIEAPAELLPGWLEKLVQKLVPLGLDGLEAYHSGHCNADARLVLELADKYKLLVSGGSDFHGGNRPEVHLGKVRGGLRVPACILEKLRARAREKQGGNTGEKILELECATGGRAEAAAVGWRSRLTDKEQAC
jgi:predicted metal-dependent phosphoesterase TrpH